MSALRGSSLHKKKKKKSTMTSVNDVSATLTGVSLTDKTSEVQGEWSDVKTDPSQGQTRVRIVENPFKSRVPDDCLRFVCISDTHNQTEFNNFVSRVPDGDVLLHAGDFTLYGEFQEFVQYDQFLQEFSHPIKITIPGNHEISLDPRAIHFNIWALRKGLGLPVYPDNPIEYKYEEVIDKLTSLVPNSIILTDSWVSVCGIKIYGIPWVPIYGAEGFGLREDDELISKANLIPDDTDILLSHGPPRGFGDLTHRKVRVGCPHLAKSLHDRVQPKVVVSGHIHEGHGVSTDDTTTYINASACNRGYRPKQDPIVFDYPLPQGFTRKHFLKLKPQELVIIHCS